MAKRLTVFYSWQSDSPSNLNRNFIEKALLEALKRLNSDVTLENALREATVELDKDTQGVAGSLRDVVKWQSELLAYGKPAWEILGPFFDRVWDNCGFQRTSQQQAELVKRFTH